MIELPCATVLLAPLAQIPGTQAPPFKSFTHMNAASPPLGASALTPVRLRTHPLRKRAKVP